MRVFEAEPRSTTCRAHRPCTRRRWKCWARSIVRRGDERGLVARSSSLGPADQPSSPSSTQRPQERHRLSARRPVRAAQDRQYVHRAAAGLSARRGAHVGRVKACRSPDGVEITVETAAASAVTGRYLVGADGGRSTVRKALGIEFEGYTFPERFLVLTTPFDFAAERAARALLLRPGRVGQPVQGRGRRRRPALACGVRPSPARPTKRCSTDAAKGGCRSSSRRRPIPGRASQSLQRAPARRRDLPEGPRVPGRRLRAREQPDRRARPQLRHPRRRRAGPRSLPA